MQVTIRQEAGYELSLYGMSLSFKDRSIKPEDWWQFECTGCDKGDANCYYGDNMCGLYESRPKRMGRMERVATQNANRGLGHNKFRRQVMLWLDIEAPRFWWSEFDTYKVGTVAQSESTMHTLTKRAMVKDDLETPDQFDLSLKDLFNKYLDLPDRTLEQLKKKLPESYLQRRLVTLNYEVLATIINQRKNHRLPQWAVFINSIYDQCEHVELLPERPVYVKQ